MPTTEHTGALHEDREIHDLLNESEDEGLLRLTKLVEHLFKVPAAYIALLGPDLKVVRRIGSGAELWDNMKTFPLSDAFGKLCRWSATDGTAVDGFTPGALRFAAWAPLRTGDGIDLGLLAILDTRDRPDFSAIDQNSLAELASVLAGKMELRRLALRARESELSYKEAERRFRSIANSAPVMIIYAGIDGSTSFVNSAWLEFTGRHLEDEVGDGFEDRFHPDYRESVMQTYWEAFQARRPLTLEFPMLRHDGEYRWMQARGMPRVLDDGSYTGYIGSFIDMTEQRSAATALRTQVACTAAIAETARASYAILDPKGRVDQSSPDLGKIHGHFIWDACAGDAEEANRMRDAVRQIPVRKETVSISQWGFRPIFSDKGELIAVTAIAVAPIEGGLS